MKVRNPILTVCLTVFIPCLVKAADDPKSEAKWLIERLTGTKISIDSALLSQAAALVAAGDRAGAARLATDQPNFLNITVKHMALKMSNRDETIRVNLNDFAAAFMGVARDNVDARELLKGDFSYQGDPAKLAGTTVRQNLSDDILLSENHYIDLERQNDAGSLLLRVDGQRLVLDDNKNTVANPDPAGVLTSRAFMKAHAIDGTNRRLVEFTFREFACLPIDQWADTNASDLRIGRDIDRFPGGDHQKFQTSCKGCHTVMDGFRGAFAKWDFRNETAILSSVGGTGRARAAADGNGVGTKMNKNNTVYPGGYVTTDDSWVNNASRGTNASVFGWSGDSIQSGKGVRALGTLISNSKRFGQCMAKRVFESVCRKTMPATSEKALMVELGLAFEKDQYNLKKLFQTVALRTECR